MRTQLALTAAFRALLALLFWALPPATRAETYRASFTDGDEGWTGYYRYPQGHRTDRGFRARGCLYADSGARFTAPQALTGNLRERFGEAFLLKFAISDYYDYGGVAHLVVTSASSRWQWTTDIDSPTQAWQEWTAVVRTDDPSGWRRLEGEGAFPALWEDVTSVDIIPTKGAGMHFDDVECLPAPAARGVPGEKTYALPLRVTSELNFPRVPVEAQVDFGQVIGASGLPGVLDPNSVLLVDQATGETVPHSTEGLEYGDQCRIGWVVTDPGRRDYELRFRTARDRPVLAPKPRVPLIGVGDLLHYNAGEPRPVTPILISGLQDMDGDGKRDLVGTWIYAHRPGTPWSGAVYFPRVGSPEEFRFGDMIRLPGLPGPTYCFFAVGDLDRDGQPDLVYTSRNARNAEFFLNTGDPTPAGHPTFEKGGHTGRAGGDWMPVRIADLNADGTPDLVFGKWRVYSEGTIPEGSPTSVFVYNANTHGLPFEAGATNKVALGGIQPDFIDLDSDGLLDVVCLVPDPTPPGLSTFRVGWQRNLGGDPPRFSECRLLSDVNTHAWRPTGLAAVRDGPRKGILLVTWNWQKCEFYEVKQPEQDEPRFAPPETAASMSAVILASDQAAPFVCDWDDDGDRDLLVGGGYGWPHVYVNAGSDRNPAYEGPRFVHAQGKPIRLVRDDVLGPPECWHDMGYPFPAYVDWDHDGLKDLMLPNETNRILWYKNLGTPASPKFGARSQVLVDGFPDSAQLRTETAELVSNHPHVYPTDERQPFYWRSGAAFVDMNADGLLDLITRQWSKYSLGLFLRYRNEAGELRLRRAQTLKTVDGKQFSGTRVNAVDWDGDGLLDLVYSVAMSKPGADTVFLARNAGTGTGPVFEAPRPLRCFGKPIYITRHGPHPWVGDLDGDNRPDLLCYTEWSVFPFYAHAALEMPHPPELQFGTVAPVP